MKTELEDQFSAWLNEAILQANKGEKLCECGQIILDRDKTSIVLTEVVNIAMARLVAFAVVAESDADLHVPDPNRSGDQTYH